MLQSSNEGAVYITDCGSSNGTFVNGKRVATPLELRTGDEIRIGNQVFSFHQETAAVVIEASDEIKPTNVVFVKSLITVLVADIRGFTLLAQQIEPCKLSRVTGKLFREAGKVLQDRGVWTQKYIGDAIMAVWLHRSDAPEAHELKAIVEAQIRLAEIAAGLQAQFDLDVPIRIGAGINTGWASIGNVGSLASSDYTALGDVVNRAFRLESATKELACDFVVGQGAYAFLANSSHSQTFFQPCEVSLKGYEESATVYAGFFSSLPGLLAALNPENPL